jgi:UDP-N-acetyl-D-galactosamine dehydrogenase
MKYDLKEAIVCVIGLGYVGLPLARAFAKSLSVIGYDVDSKKVSWLKRLEGAKQPNICFTSDPKEIARADFIIICVPTPITGSKEPDLSCIRAAAGIVSKNMKKGCVVILESTVYPGVTEEVLKPIMEESGLRCGRDFKIAYCPERINPGDEEHSIDKITKVIAGMDADTTELVAELYSKVTPHIFRVKDIKTAEAAKVIENVQRDLNIALVNELSLIFEKMGLNTREVLEAASTKWNFHSYSPGLVGGHCIPVDPYYLVYKAKELGYHPQVILAGRAINDSMPKHIAEMAVKALNAAGKVIKGSRVLLMGLTYKEDVADIRETPARGIIGELKDYGIEVIGYDPMVTGADLEDKFGIKLLDNLTEITKDKVEGIIISVAHSAFRKLKLTDIKKMQNPSPVLIDVRGIFNANEARKAGLYYRTL